MTEQLRAYLNQLEVAEFDFASDYAGWWLNGGREPRVADYDVAMSRQAEIAGHIRAFAVQPQEAVAWIGGR